MTDTNTLRRLNWLWKHRHNHDGDDTTRQLTVIRQEISQIGGSIEDSGAGAFYHATRGATQSIASGGAAIEWDTQYFGIPSFRFDVTLPATEITIPVTGYYDIVFDFGWESWTGGGTVTILRNSIQVWPPAGDPGTWESSYGRVFEEETVPAIPCTVGDTLAVVVDHGDGSAQNLSSATLAVYLIDRHLLLAAESGAAGYREVILNDGPVAYWRLGEPEGDNTAFDETGNGHDGTYTTLVDQGVTGLIVDDPNLAAQFSQTASDGVNVPIHNDLKFINSDYTHEAWVKVVDTLTQFRYIISWVREIGGAEWGISVADSGGSLRFEARRRNGTAVATTPFEFSYDTIYHVVVTYNDTTDDVKVYVNAVEKATGSHSTALTDSGTGGIRIGRHDGNGIPAVIDEVALWNKVLSPSQVTIHYNAGLGVF